jgi:hypothetical protein
VRHGQRDANQGSQPDSDAGGHRRSNRHIDRGAHGNPHRRTQPQSQANRDCFAHSGAHRDTDVDRDADADSNSDANGHGNAERDSRGYPDAGGRRLPADRFAGRVD